MTSFAHDPVRHSPALLLGIDTGGTYTDAVVYDEHTRTVVAKAKAPTTHHDLSIGIRDAIDGALAAASIDAMQIELVALSTTLATNALVEGSGRPVGAVIIGFDAAVIDRGGLAAAVGSDPVIFVRGGHDSHGAPIDAVDLSGLEAQLLDVASHVDAFAVTAQFSVRNPEHEIAASELIRRLTGRPVTCSYHLSARLDGPKRAVTAVLNARLISIIDELVDTTPRTLVARGVDAPLMVVRGDGSLVSSAFVRERPIETILSGPAASLVGAAHLTGVTDAVIADIGGTTTDIAVLRDGTPTISAEGASVGGHRTMVSAVAMSTHGLGGDSHVRHDPSALGAELQIGPRRVVPVSQLAVTQRTTVLEALDRQLSATNTGELDGMFVIVARGTARAHGASDAERRVLDTIDATGSCVVALDTIATSMSVRRTVERLVRRRALALSAFTPTDASHVLGMQQTFDAEAARLAAALLARRPDRVGRDIAPDATTLAELTVATLVRRSGECVLGAAFADEGLPDDAVTGPVVQAAIDRLTASGSGALDRSSVVDLRVGLAGPLVALGASAGIYYPRVAALVGTHVIVPTHADVANAVGAVVGRVRLTRQCTISTPQRGQFVAHDGVAPRPFVDLEAALAHATAQLHATLATEMRAAGATVFEITTRWDEQTVDVEGMPMFVEGVVTATSVGRPNVAARPPSSAGDFQGFVK